MDEVARDAKRLLLRYGAPITVVDKLPEDDRISFARSIIRTTLSDRPAKVKQLLTEGGWIETK
ncbi:MAG TPA: hypothetical protein VJ957_03530 [Longimicrobiales bacterium]|nr:hypothetical protein [Longimicrobiales bacterium]